MKGQKRAHAPIRKEKLILDKWVKLHIRKQFINFAIRVMNALLPERKAQYPQTKMLADIYADLFRVYNLEVFAGRFDDVPYQVLKTLKDKNFLRTLELSGKLLTYLGDTDRYYRQWLGLFLLLARDHVENFSFTDACQLISEQWNYKLYGKFLNDLFNYDKDLAVDVILANHLPNLVKLTLNRGEKTQ